MGREAGRRILVLGAHGQVGHELPRALSALGQVDALDRSGADLAAPESLRMVVRQRLPDIIVNAAAYTAVDRAESEPDLANTVNALSPQVLAEEAQAGGACLVHYSTDYVFDGRKGSAYDETDAPHPLSTYGRSKLAGERAVADACTRHLILRTSWVFGAHGANFLKTILRLGAERDSLSVVADQFGAPTGAALIADVTAGALHALAHASEHDARWGLYHLAASGYTSWHGYAQHVIGRARELGMSLRATPETINAISTAEYPTAATRPANSRLCTARLRAAFALELPDWTGGVDQVLDQLRAEEQR
jgi:dTDP-4-dehydrorhamnose reductase